VLVVIVQRQVDDFFKVLRIQVHMSDGLGRLPLGR
jgi:hypothetical protein